MDSESKRPRGASAGRTTATGHEFRSIMTSAPALTRSSSEAKSFAASASEIWITSLAMQSLYTLRPSNCERRHANRHRVLSHQFRNAADASMNTSSDIRISHFRPFPYRHRNPLAKLRLARSCKEQQSRARHDVLCGTPAEPGHLAYFARTSERTS